MRRGNSSKRPNKSGRFDRRDKPRAGKPGAGGAPGPRRPSPKKKKPIGVAQPGQPGPKRWEEPEKAPTTERIQLPPRVKAPEVPARTKSPRAGRWVWTCRAGFEAHLFEELAWMDGNPKLLGATLVESDKTTGTPWFGRAGFEVTGVVEGARCEDPHYLARELVRFSAPKAHVQVWSVDAPTGHARAEAVKGLREVLTLRTEPTPAAAESAGATAGATSSENAPAGRGAPTGILQPGGAVEWLATAQLARERSGWLSQVCLVDAGLTILGRVRARDAVSLAPGGQARMVREQGPSRAAMKLDEALSTLSIEPSRGEECVDLGAAPGGWTARLVARGAKVIAVDPANLTPELAKDRRVVHVKDSAFTFAPEAPVDWLFCDMAWRPLEVAQLLAKWGRNGWALYLVANIKLPMQDKNPILYRVRHVLEQHGNWREIKIRQLYHDRDEVTVTARRLLGREGS